MIKTINIRRLILPMLAVMMLASCGNGNDDTPKPKAYLRIDLPAHSYSTCDTAALPFTFQQSALATLLWKKSTPQEQWLTLQYPQYKGYVFLTYKRLRSPNELAAQVDTSYKFIEGHYSFASGIDENKFVDPAHKLYGTTYHLKGQNVASTYQFWATDSTRHFLRGALYIDCTPNNDSLAPVIEYIQADMDRLIESIRWREN